MARADTASASAHPDSINGLAQSIAKPAYRRLLNAEPLLRRAVPVLIIAFLATICVGALVQVLDHRRQTLASRCCRSKPRPILRRNACIVRSRGRQPRSSGRRRCLRRSLPPWAMTARAALYSDKP